jgi:hypothetical protein
MTGRHSVPAGPLIKLGAHIPEGDMSCNKMSNL